jgi:subtilisin family serine protease
VAAPGVRIYSLGLGRQVLWSENFDDAALAGWTSGGALNTWAVRSAPAMSGSSVLAVSPDDRYADDTDSWVMSPPLNLSAAAACQLGFQLIGSSESGRDSLFVEVSTDSTVWSILPVKVGGDIRYNGISGSIPYWTTATVDLGRWDGTAQCYVRFRFSSDAANTNTGFFIDNLFLSAASAADAYQFMSGTSMAAGFVSGVAALVLSQHDNLTTSALRSILLASVDLDQSLAGLTSTGGRINAFNALTLLGDLSLSADSTGANAIRLNWSGQVPLGGQIAVQRRAVGEEDFQVVANVDASGSGYTDLQVEPETTYYYRVLAQTQDGRSGYSNQTAATTGNTAAVSGGGDGGGGGGGCFIGAVDAWIR